MRSPRYPQPWANKAEGTFRPITACRLHDSDGDISQTPDPIFKNHNHLGALDGSQSAVPVLFSQPPVRQAGGHREPHVTDGEVEAPGTGSSQVSTQTGLANCHLLLAPSPLLLPSTLDPNPHWTPGHIRVHHSLSCWRLWKSQPGLQRQPGLHI